MKDEISGITDHVTNKENELPLVIGVDLGGTQLRAAVLRGATLITRVGLLTGENPAPDRVIPRMFQAVRQALTEAQVSLDQITGIGIGAPGPLDAHTGIVFDPPNLPGWNNVPLRDLFSAEFSVPIFLENDANAGALGEYMFGAGQNCTDLVYLTISTGIGGGVISDGRILDGATGTAGELGHITIDWHGERCNCGNIGCLEQIASGTAIARQANEAIALGNGDELLTFALAHPEHDKSANTPVDSKISAATPMHLNTRMVAQAAQAGIPLAHNIIHRAAEALGVGLVDIIHIFNPEIIILGGSVTQIGDLFLEPALHIVATRTMRLPREAVRIVAAKLGNDVGLIGAGALIYYNK